VAALSLVFDLLARDRASSEFRRVGDAAERAGRQGHGFGTSISGGMKLAAGALAAAGLGTMFAGFISDAAESAKIGRLTTQVIKSTGGAAGITAKQVGDLATAISNKTGVDDEAIQSASNLLLTFTNVRNEAGKGNDIFNRTTQIATDMSAALGTDASKSAMQLGKALNDPIKGVSALSRVGVSFTAQQKAQIKTLVESGNTLGAQKVILAEVGKEFGGAAEAAANPMDRLKVIAGNLGEQIGGYLLPYVGQFADFISTKAIPAISKFWEWMGPKLGAVLHEVVGGIKAFAAAWSYNDGEITSSGLPGFMERLGYIAHQVFDTLKQSVTAFVNAWKYNDGEVTSSGLPGFFERVGYYAHQTFDYVQKNVIPVLISFGGWVKNNSTWLLQVGAALLAAVAAFKVFMFIKSVITAVAAFNAVLLANPIGLVIAALAALVAGLVIAYKNSETFRSIVDGAFKAVAAVASWMWNNVLKPYFTALWTLWTSVAKGIGWAWTNLIKPVFSAFGKLIGVVKDSFSAAVTGIKNIWGGLVDALKKPVQIVVDTVWNNGLRKLWNVINNIWGGGDLPAFKMASGGVLPISRRGQFATGGVLPGYTPGRDVHTFVSPTGGRLELSGGEAVMRPEFTRALGVAGIDRLNKLARTEGVNGLMSVLGGGEDFGVQSFAGGGVVSLPGWLNTALKVVPGGGAIKGFLNNINGANLGGGLFGSGLRDMVGSIAGKFWDKAKSLAGDVASSVWNGAKSLLGFGGGGKGSMSLVAFGRRLQGMGARVSEHPAFGGVTPGAHVRGSAHYVGKAFDVNTRPGTSALEQRELDPMAALARKLGFKVLWKVPGHFNHLHVASYAAGTNFVPETGMAMVHKGEAIVPVSHNQGAPFAGGPVEITGTLRIDGDGLARIVDGRIVGAMKGQYDRAAY